jgi:hypothetical protein
MSLPCSVTSSVQFPSFSPCYSFPADCSSSFSLFSSRPIKRTFEDLQATNSPNHAIPSFHATPSPSSSLSPSIACKRFKLPSLPDSGDYSMSSVDCPSGVEWHQQWWNQTLNKQIITVDQFEHPQYTTDY